MKHHKEEHGLRKYASINALTTKNPLALVEKIRQVPIDYERYRFFLEELQSDPGLNLSVIETSRVAAVLMQLEKYDEWSYDKSVEELAQFETTNDRLRKMNEYVLNYLLRSKKGDMISDSVGAAKQVLLELKGEDGELKLEWKREEEPLEIEYKEVDNEQHNKQHNKQRDKQLDK